MVIPLPIFLCKCWKICLKSVCQYHFIFPLNSPSSYRFMDMFPDAGLVREIQQELDSVIQVGVRNITRLIRATETQGPSTAPAVEAKTSPFPGLRLRKARGSKSQVHDKQDLKGTDRSLGARLVQEGLLTPELLQQLQREWTKDQTPSGIGTMSKNKKKK